ncbi:hypothetical protein RB653_005690 [Dictyostelium firmibasis]|uniref:Uncharacterized protein n=1 Tax=Dictyostelium firmibasis TaxID=79012 RepID=A0AAN7UBX9_9MYCE
MIVLNYISSDKIIQKDQSII